MTDRTQAGKTPKRRCDDRTPHDDSDYPEANADVNHLPTREGPFTPTYDPDFLGFRIGVPQDETDDSLELDGSPVIPYTHYCLAMSKSRKLARWVAWNIDGGSLKTTDRVAFYPEKRLDDEQQILNKAYKHSELDRGHVARRADLIWGPDEEAIRANNQSFAYTNITPQMNNFNESDKCGLWGDLEDAVLHQDTLRGGRVSVFAGPFLAEDDPEYRDGYVQLPRAFFKTVVYVLDDELRARSFILDQNFDGLRPLTPLDEFRVRPVPLAEVAERASLTFDKTLQGADRAGLKREIVAAEPEFIDDTSQVRW